MNMSNCEISDFLHSNPKPNVSVEKHKNHVKKRLGGSTIFRSNDQKSSKGQFAPTNFSIILMEKLHSSDEQSKWLLTNCKVQLLNHVKQQTSYKN